LGTLLAAWCAWAFLGRLSVIEASTSARLESRAQAHAVDSPLTARIEHVRVSLGARVHSGDVLVELEDAGRRHALEEARARLRVEGDQLAGLQIEEAQESALLLRLTERAQRERSEAEARLEQARSEARLAAAEEDKARGLLAAGLLAELDQLRASARFEQAQAAAEAARRNLERLDAELRVEQQRASTRRARLQQQQTGSRSAHQALAARARQAEDDLARLHVRAPIGGHVGWLIPQGPGAVVEGGARLVEIVPEERARIVASFPQSALGRLRAGQSARMRLDAFPWAQHGLVLGQVSAIATEMRDGGLRVELDIETSDSIPLKHGLTGQVEVTIERVTPLELLLRAAGAAARRPGQRPSGP
jgi:membrane fusion protein (multidrug efflux system)